MDIKDFTKEFLKTLNINDVSDLSDALMKTVYNKDKLNKLIKTYDKLIKKADNINYDYLQGLYEFFLSNREELNQDYTPKSLAKLVGMLSNHENEHTIYDMCAGMGSLTLAKFKSHTKCNYILKEVDINVLPFLLFKLCYYKVNAKVYIEDVLYNNRDKEYTVRNGVLVNELPLGNLKVDTIVSNPPFNVNANNNPVKTSQMIFEKSLNYAWVFKALDDLNENGVCVFILPNMILTNESDKKYRKYLIDNDLLDVVINIPNKFFINTDIPTTIIKINKNKPKHRKGKVTLIKSKPTGLFERKQKGEDHMKTRVYTKTFFYFKDTDLVEIAEAIKKQNSEKDFSITVTNDKLKENDYIISPSRYIELKPIEDTSRSFKDIVNDIKRCDTRRGLVKLTINQKLAKQFNIDTVNMDHGIEDIFNNLRSLLKNNPDAMGDLTFEDLDYKFLKYLQFSKKKNELKFEQNSKDVDINEMFVMMLQLWIQNVLMWNNEQNNYLKELLDKLLPLLMKGDLNVDGVSL